MNHQPFETWLLTDEPLSPENAQSLSEHLSACQHCQELQQAWLEVSELFEIVPEVEPEAGFSERWQARWQAEKQVDLAIRQRWHSWIGLILVANAAAMTLVLLGAGLFSVYDSPVELFLSGVYRLSTYVGVLSWLQNMIAPLLRVLPGIIPVSWWLVGIGVLAAASVLWVFMIARFAKISSLSRRA